MIDQDRENDVLAAFCHNGTVQTVFMNSLLQVFAHDVEVASGGGKRRLVEYHDASGPYIHDNRARIVRYFLDHTDHQWLWFLDNDMEFPPDSLDRLLAAAEEHDIKILGAAYWNKYAKLSIYLSWLLMTDQGIRAAKELPPTPEPVELSAVGMGCTLIHRDALQDVVDFQRAHFPDDPWDSFGCDLLKYDDGTADRMGEDVTFCLRARRVGYKTFGLPTLVAEHYKAIFIPHGMAALHDPQMDAEGGTNGALSEEDERLIELVPSERT